MKSLADSRPLPLVSLDPGVSPLLLLTWEYKLGGGSALLLSKWLVPNFPSSESASRPWYWTRGRFLLTAQENKLEVNSTQRNALACAQISLLSLLPVPSWVTSYCPTERIYKNHRVGHGAPLLALSLTWTRLSCTASPCQQAGINALGDLRCPSCCLEEGLLPCKHSPLLLQAWCTSC